MFMSHTFNRCHTVPSGRSVLGAFAMTLNFTDQAIRNTGTQSGAPMHDSTTTHSFLRLDQHLSGHLYAFLLVRDLLSFSNTSKDVLLYVLTSQYWFTLCARRWPALLLSPASVSAFSPAYGSRLYPLKRSVVRNEPTEEYVSCLPSSRAYKNAMERNCFRSIFLQHAEAELNWRRGRPTTVIQERLEMPKEVSSSPVKALALVRVGTREVMLAAKRYHVGAYRVGDSGHLPLSKGPELLLRAKSGNSMIYTMVVASGDPAKLLVAGNDTGVEVLDWTVGRKLASLHHHASSVWCLGVDTDSHPDAAEACGQAGGTLMVASGGYCSLALSDVDRQAEAAIAFHGHQSWIRGVHLDMGRHLLITGSADATCKAWDLRRPGRVLTKFVHPNHFEEVRCLECAGPRLVTGCYDGVVREYDLGTGRYVSTLAKHEYAVETMQLSRETGRLVSVDWDGQVAYNRGMAYLSRTFGAQSVDTLALVHDVGEMQDISRDAFGRASGGSNHFVRPRYEDKHHGKIIGCDLQASALFHSEDGISHTRTSVACMQHDEERLVLGTTGGNVVSLLFRKSLNK